MSNLAEKVKGAVRKLEDKIHNIKERRRSKGEEHPAAVTSASDADDIREEPLAPQITHAAATGESTTTGFKDEPQLTSGFKEQSGDAHASQGEHAPGHTTQTGQGMHGNGTQLHDQPVGFGSTTMERSFGNEPGTGVTTSGRDLTASTTQPTRTDEGNGRI